MVLLALPPADHLLNERDRGQFVPSRRRRVMANVRAERLLKTPAEPGPELRIPALGDGSFTSIPSCARSLASAPPPVPGASHGRRRLKAERPVSFHGLLMCMREFAARRAKMDAILRKNHMADAAARAAPKSSNG